MITVRKIQNVIKENGRISTLADIYSTYEKLYPEDLIGKKAWTSLIRNLIYFHAEECDKHNNKYPILFYSVNGKGSGVWGLCDVPNSEVNLPSISSLNDMVFPEGALYEYRHMKKERNSKLIHEAKKRFLQQHGKIYCQICGFNFYEKYGVIGKDFIEAHHIIPISDVDAEYDAKVEDIILVCSNCHSMLHIKRPWLTADELKKLLK